MRDLFVDTSANRIRTSASTFVTVGNATQPFPRLLEAVDRLVRDDVLEKRVLVQSGNNPNFVPTYCEHVPFLSPEEFETWIAQADLIVSHAGAGTLFHVFQAGKTPVVMPRRKQNGELVDDHQIELARALAAEGRVVAAYEVEDLPEAIAEARERQRKEKMPSPVRMVSLLTEAVEDIARRNDRPVFWRRSGRSGGSVC
jgi:UDP-N-acetylglucosamine transferase subunit ALG13